MSINKILASELDYKRYVTELGLNPDNVYYQSISSNNVTTSNCQWTITSPNKRSLLLSYAVVNWQPSITRFRADGITSQGWGNSVNGISLKPCLPFANAMSSITMSVNGNTITLSQPRRFIESLTMACVNKEEARSCFETGYPDNMGSHASLLNPGAPALYNSYDSGFEKNEANFNDKLLRTIASNDPLEQKMTSVANPVVLTGDAANQGFQEPLIVPPFNPFSKLTQGMPGYMWFKNMSPVIPNVDRLEIDIQFVNLSPSVLYPRFVQTPANNELKQIKITALAADIKLWWYEVPVNMSIPRSIDLQTWNVREFSSTAQVAGNAELLNTMQSPLIQLNSTPTLIGIHIERNKDTAAQYLPNSASRDDDLAGGNPGTTGLTSWDSFAEIRNLQILLGDRPNVISTNFTQRELYYLTLKNSKTPFPYSYEDWRGSSRANLGATGIPTANATRLWNGSKCVVFLRPKDIAEKISDGVFAPNSFQVIANATGRHGTHGLGAAAAEPTWVMYVHLYYGKHFLRLEPDKAQFQEQSIPLDTARRITNPVLETQGVSGLGSGLEGLRLRSEPSGGALTTGGGYQSRL